MFKYGKKKPQGATRHAPKTTTSNTPKSALSSWLLVGFGITVGLFVASGLYWWQPWQPVEQAQNAPITDANNPSSAPKTGEPKFVFYDLLPNQEILTQPAPTEEVPAKKVVTTAQATPSSTTQTTATAEKTKEQIAKEKLIKDKKEALAKEQKLAKQKALDDKIAALQKEPKDSNRYALQAGSFKSKAEADRHRATVMLAGLPVKVQKVTIKAGEEWYRVVVGPFTGKDNASDARKNLQREGVDSLVVKQD